MQRYQLTEYSLASKETQAVYDDFMQMTGATSVPIWLQSLGHSAALARAYWERAKGTLFFGSLPLALKEMVVFAVSAQNGARYCSACHAQNVLALDQTLAFSDLEGLVRTQQTLNLPAFYRTVVEFAIKVAAGANCLEDADFERLLDEGFSREEVCEIIAVIDMTTMFNVYTSALQLDLDPNYRAIL